MAGSASQGAHGSKRMAGSAWHEAHGRKRKAGSTSARRDPRRRGHAGAAKKARPEARHSCIYICIQIFIHTIYTQTLAFHRRRRQRRGRSIDAWTRAKTSTRRRTSTRNTQRKRNTAGTTQNSESSAVRPRRKAETPYRRCDAELGELSRAHG
jgi:hypothetical protein